MQAVSVLFVDDYGTGRGVRGASLLNVPVGSIKESKEVKLRYRYNFIQY